MRSWETYRKRKGERGRPEEQRNTHGCRQTEKTERAPRRGLERLDTQSRNGSLHAVGFHKGLTSLLCDPEHFPFLLGALLILYRFEAFDHFHRGGAQAQEGQGLAQWVSLKEAEAGFIGELS